MTPTTIRIQESFKRDAQKLAKAMGVSFNDLINMLIARAVKDNGVDMRGITITENGFTPEFEQSVLDAEKEGDAMGFDSVDEMIKYAKNED